MNAGFSNLTDLKAYLLAASLRDGSDYDAAISSIGLGVASLCENYCNRKFARTVATTDVLGADQAQFFLSRYPVEALTKIELKITEADGWVEQTINDFIRTLDSQSGIVYLPDKSDPADYYAQLRFTYTGGYFWEQLEPTDGGYPTAQPVGSITVPADLKLAWLTQCAIVWQAKDKLGDGILKAGPAGQFVTGGQAGLELAPMVKAALDQFRRIQMV